MPTRHHLRRAEGRDRPRASRRCRAQLQRIARFALERPQDLALDTVAAVAASDRGAALGDGPLRQGARLSAASRTCSGCSAAAWSSARQLPRAHRPAAPQQRTASARRRRRAARASSATRSPTCATSRSTSRRARSSAPCELLAGAGRIHVLAQRRAFPVACYLAYALDQLELPAHLLDGVGGMVREQPRAIGRGDVLVAVSFRNYSPEVIELAARLHARGVPVIVITDSACRRWRAAPTVALRPRRRPATAVPLAGRAAVPRAGAGGERRPRAGRQAGAAARRAPRPRHCKRSSALDAAISTLACMGRAAVDLYGEQIGGRLEDMPTFARTSAARPPTPRSARRGSGLQPAMITRVGDEHNGRFVRETLAREGVDVSQVTTDPKRLTALVFLAIRDRDDLPARLLPRPLRRHGARRRAHRRGVHRALRALLVSGHAPVAAGPARARAHGDRGRARARGTRVVLDIDYRPVLWGLAQPGRGRSSATSPSDAGRARICSRAAATATSSSAPRRRSASPAARRHARGAARLRAADRGAVVRQARRRWAASASTAPSPSARGRAAGPGLPGRGLQRPRRGRCVHGGVPARLAARRAARALLRLRQRLRRARRLAPRLRAGDAELDRSCSTSSRTARRRRGCARTPRSSTCTARPRAAALAASSRARLRPPLPARGARRARTARGARAHRALQGAGRRWRSRARRERRVAGAGVILDDRYGEDVLPRLTGTGYWIARPVELPGSRPAGLRGRRRTRRSRCAPGRRSTSRSASCTPSRRPGGAARGAARAAGAAAARLRRPPATSCCSR